MFHDLMIKHKTLFKFVLIIIFIIFKIKKFNYLSLVIFILSIPRF